MTKLRLVMAGVSVVAACNGGGENPPPGTAHTIQRVIIGHGSVILHDGFEDSTLDSAAFDCAMDTCTEMPGLEVASTDVSFGAVPAAGYHFVSAKLDETTITTPGILLDSEQTVYVLTVTFEEDAGNPGCKFQDPTGPAEAVSGACTGFDSDMDGVPSTIICDLRIDGRTASNMVRVEIHGELAETRTPGTSPFDGNYQTCNPCMVGFPEQDGAAPVPAEGDTYVAQSGDLQILAAPEGRVRMRVKNAALLHVLIDPVTFLAAPDPDGCQSLVWGLEIDAPLTLQAMP